jgi:hypothetical protein
VELLAKVVKCKDALDSLAWTSYDLHISLATSAKATLDKFDSQVVVMRKDLYTRELAIA